jgi:putative membrane protein
MLTDALLAWLHHQAIFLLIVALTAEAFLLRPDIQSPAISRLLNYDRIYLAGAILVVITGGLHLAFGVKGLAFYMSNPWFHTKIAVFIAIGLCSIPPTLFS